MSCDRCIVGERRKMKRVGRLCAEFVCRHCCCGCHICEDPARFNRTSSIIDQADLWSSRRSKRPDVFRTAYDGLIYLRTREREHPSKIIFFRPYPVSSGEGSWHIADCLYWPHTSPSIRKRKDPLLLGLYPSPEAKRSAILQIASSALVPFPAPGIEGFVSCSDHIDLSKRSGLTGGGLPIAPTCVFRYLGTMPRSPVWTACISEAEATWHIASCVWLPS
jgi:hypothetical protein